MRSTLRRSLAATAVLGTLGSLAACGDDAHRAVPAVQVSASDAAFSVPATIAPGLTSLRFSVDGTAPHQLQLLRLNQGVTTDQVFAAAASPDPGPLFGLVSVAGGVGAVAPGGSGSATVDLAPGTYVAFDFTSPATKPGVFQVTGSATDADAPRTTGTVHLVDFGVDMPATVRRGEVFTVVNDGQQPHELALFALPVGMTKEDLVAALHAEGQPAVTPVGGLGAINPGERGYLDIDLPPGNYAAMCFVPDPASGSPHAHLGMVATFTVG